MSVPLDLNLHARYNREDEKSIVDLVDYLKQVEGAISYDSDSCCQVLLPLKGGGHLRIGVSDHKEALFPFSIWADRYQGLPIQGNLNLQTGETF